jgi:hypothetical protein
LTQKGYDIVNEESDPLADRDARWQSLVDQFNLKKPGVDPWDAVQLSQSFKGASHGERCSISFLLNVWSPSEEWDCGKFDLIDAMGVWDDDQLAAFKIWFNNPWWP